MSGEQDASGRPAPRSSDGRPLMVNNIYVQNAYGLDDLDRKVSQAMTRSLSRVLPRKS